MGGGGAEGRGQGCYGEERRGEERRGEGYHDSWRVERIYLLRDASDGKRQRVKSMETWIDTVDRYGLHWTWASWAVSPEEIISLVAGTRCHIHTAAGPSASLFSPRLNNRFALRRVFLLLNCLTQPLPLPQRRTKWGKLEKIQRAG